MAEDARQRRRRIFTRITLTLLTAASVVAILCGIANESSGHRIKSLEESSGEKTTSDTEMNPLVAISKKIQRKTKSSLQGAAGDFQGRALESNTDDFVIRRDRRRVHTFTRNLRSLANALLEKLTVSKSGREVETTGIPSGDDQTDGSGVLSDNTESFSSKETTSKKMSSITNFITEGDFEGIATKESAGTVLPSNLTQSHNGSVTVATASSMHTRTGDPTVHSEPETITTVLHQRFESTTTASAIPENTEDKGYKITNTSATKANIPTNTSFHLLYTTTATSTTAPHISSTAISSPSISTNTTTTKIIPITTSTAAMQPVVPSITATITTNTSAGTEATIFPSNSSIFSPTTNTTTISPLTIANATPSTTTIPITTTPVTTTPDTTVITTTASTVTLTSTTTTPITSTSTVTPTTSPFATPTTTTTITPTTTTTAPTISTSTATPTPTPTALPTTTTITTPTTTTTTTVTRTTTTTTTPTTTTTITPTTTTTALPTTTTTTTPTTTTTTTVTRTTTTTTTPTTTTTTTPTTTTTTITTPTIITTTTPITTTTTPITTTTTPFTTTTTTSTTTTRTPSPTTTTTTTTTSSTSTTTTTTTSTTTKTTTTIATTTTPIEPAITTDSSTSTESAIIVPPGPRRRKKGREDYTKIILLWIVAAVLVAAVLAYVYYDHRKVKIARKRQRILMEKKLQQKKEKEKLERKKKRPRQMRAAKLDPREFKARGPLVLQAALRGEVKHRLDEDKSVSLKKIKFDPSQNEIFLIGTDIERLEGQSQSIEQGDRTYENLDPMSKTQPTPTTTPAPKALMRSIDRTQTPSLESDDTTTTRFTGSREKTASSGSAEKTKTS